MRECTRAIKLVHKLIYELVNKCVLPKEELSHYLGHGSDGSA